MCLAVRKINKVTQTEYQDNYCEKYIGTCISQCIFYLIFILKIDSGSQLLLRREFMKYRYFRGLCFGISDHYCILSIEFSYQLDCHSKVKSHFTAIIYNLGRNKMINVWQQPEVPWPFFSFLFLVMLNVTPRTCVAPLSTETGKKRKGSPGDKAWFGMFEIWVYYIYLLRKIIQEVSGYNVKIYFVENMIDH